MYQKINDTTFEKITEVRQIITLEQLNELLKMAREREFRAKDEAEAIEREIEAIRKI